MHTFHYLNAFKCVNCRPPPLIKGMLGDMKTTLVVFEK